MNKVHEIQYSTGMPVSLNKENAELKTVEQEGALKRITQLLTIIVYVLNS